MTQLRFGIAAATFCIPFILGLLPSFGAMAVETDRGKAEFGSKCASCHGRGGAGDGVVAPALRTKPPDLRQLARKNGSVFPERFLVNVIDGRKSLRAHGNYEMPVWGRELSNGNSDASESARIKAIVDYLKSIQE